MALVSYTKRLRTDNDYNSISSNNSLDNLSQVCIEKIVSFLNILDARMFTLVSNKFCKIPDNYLLHNPNQIQNVFNFCYLKKSNGKIKGINSLSSTWMKGLEKSFSNLTEITLSGEWERFEAEAYTGDPEIFSKMLSSTKKLKKISLFNCSYRIIQYASTLSVEEFNLTFDIDYSLGNPLTFLWKNKNLKRFSITINSQDTLQLFSYEGKDPFAPNLEELTIQVSKTVKCTDNFNAFINRFTSLQKISIEGANFCISNLNYLPKLKEISLNVQNKINIQLNSLNSFQSLQYLTIHNLIPHQEMDRWYNDFQNSTHLKNIFFNFIDNETDEDFNEHTEEALDFLIASKIASLEKVRIKIDSSFANMSLISAINKSENHHATSIRHLALRINHLYLSETGEDMSILLNLKNRVNLDELEAVFESFSNSKTRYFFVEKTKKIHPDLLSLICFCDLISEKITCVTDYDFSWPKPVLDQLKHKPLKNCKNLRGAFEIDIALPIPTTQLLEIFPAVTPEKIDRIWSDRNFLSETEFTESGEL